MFGLTYVYDWLQCQCEVVKKSAPHGFSWQMGHAGPTENNMLRPVTPAVDSHDCFDPHSDIYAGGTGLPDDVQAEISAFDDELRMLRAAEELAEDSERCDLDEADKWIAEGFRL
jgi:hypothetical protein